MKEIGLLREITIYGSYKCLISLSQFSDLIGEKDGFLKKGRAGDVKTKGILYPLMACSILEFDVISFHSFSKRAR